MVTTLFLATAVATTNLEFSLPPRETPAWYNEARFGIFCHWGPQCAAEAGDWYARYMYYPGSGQGKHHQATYGDPKTFGFKDVINTWKGENWNPDELCALYRRMGATYIQAMANHHDNFDLWESMHQPWNSVNMGPKRDILKGWSDAARKAGLRFGISVHASHAWSWYEPARDFDGRLTPEDGKGLWWEGYDPRQLYCQEHDPSPDYRKSNAIFGHWEWGRGMKVPDAAFRENVRLRTMDAIARYKPDLIYWDDTVVPFWPVADEGLCITKDFYAMNPDAVVLGKCLTEEMRRWLTWDVERGTPPTPMYPKWQTDTCIGDWHYNKSRLQRGYRPARDVIRTLVDVVSKNGNLCLSIPIRSDGTIDELERAVCEDIAAWMAVNREAIFASDPYEICGEGPQLAKAPPINAQGFNENKIPRPTKDDVRYLKARNGRGVYAIELNPDGTPPKCPALEAKGLTRVKSFERMKDFPAVHLYEPAVLPSLAWEGLVGGNRLSCEFVAEGVVRVQYALGEELRENGTGVVVSGLDLPRREDTPGTLSSGNLSFSVDPTTGRIVFTEVSTGRVLLAESALEPHTARPVDTSKVVYDEKSARTEHTANGDIVVKDVLSRKPGEKTTQYQVRFDWQDGESLYGLGQHIEDYLDLRGKEQFLTQHNLKVAVPVLVSTAGYGLLFDAGSAMRFDDRDGAGLFEVEAAKELDYYFIYGPKMDDVIARYRRLTGECPMMPRYAFGYVQSKERYRSSDEILKTLKRYRDLEVPIDVIVQDWHYWPKGWGYMKMDPKHYPDRSALAKGVHDLNARLMVSIWPNPQKCPQEDDFRSRGFLRPNNVYDAFDPAARDLYWQYANDEFFSAGFDAWWCDCSEPMDIDWKNMPKGYDFWSAKRRWELNAEVLSDTLGVERSSLFSLYHAKGIYEHQRQVTDCKRVVNLTRSAYSGQQRYSTVTWNGDTCADWDSFKRQIPSGLNFMASGLPYWTVDVGAFFVGTRSQWFWKGKFPNGVKDPAYREYYVRMLEWAQYLPMFRSHGTETPREIWSFGERGTPHFDAIEKTIRGRYELLPYIYSLAAKVTREGYTMARLLAFDFPDDPKVRDLKDEYMFGPSLLVCPVTDPGVTSRKVYLPAFKLPNGDNGAWYDTRTGARYDAGTTIDAPAPLDSIPVFQKAGSLVVKGPVVQYADAQRGLPLEVVVAPGADAEFDLYDDDGISYDYEKGAFSVVKLLWNDATRKLAADGKTFAVKVLGAPEPWEDETVNAVNRLPARTPIRPTDARWTMNLDGEWDFTFVNDSRVPGVSSRRGVGKIVVPGCWQLKARNQDGSPMEVDPPLYTNAKYPFAFDPPCVTTEPTDKSWTSYVFRNPHGIYRKRVTLPDDWAGRRVTLRLNGYSSAVYVRVNGITVGYGEDGRLPNEFDLTSYLSTSTSNLNQDLELEVLKHCDGSYLEDQDFWRMSGLFRSVELISEATDGLRDFNIASRVENGAGVIRVKADKPVAWTLLDETGREIAQGSGAEEVKVPDVKLWCPANPVLYTVRVACAGDVYEKHFGFRTVTIEDGVLKLNGERVVIHGVDRHEMSAEGGYAMTRCEMRRDVELLKKFNINAVRTSHYPNDPYWYDLCDEHGILVVAEANVECHGSGHPMGKETFTHRPSWRTSIVERNLNQVAVLRDHPSVIIWSLGNESGGGENMIAAYEAVKAADATRPVQYEGGLNPYRNLKFDIPGTDIICPMYETPAKVEWAIQKGFVRPYILCEFSHAMGNSNGNFDEYMALIDKYPRFQGGFIWDFADQALLVNGKLKYGGDFGDKPNDGSFNCNGLFDALRNPHPGAYEVGYWYGGGKKVKVEGQGEGRRLGDAASRRVGKEDEETSLLTRQDAASPNMFEPSFSLSFWRAPTDNDRGNKLPRRADVWKKATETGVLPEGVTTNLVVTKTEKGYDVDFTLTVPDGLPELPRVGLVFEMPGTPETGVSWHGAGPHENYADRKASAPIGDYTMTVAELNDSHYVRPQECGHRTATDRLRIGNVVLSTPPPQPSTSTSSSPFEWNVQPWTVFAQEKARHVEDLPPPDGNLRVYIDAAMRGVGGDDSWGAPVHRPYCLEGTRTYHLRFELAFPQR